MINDHDRNEFYREVWARFCYDPVRVMPVPAQVPLYVLVPALCVGSIGSQVNQRLWYRIEPFHVLFAPAPRPVLFTSSSSCFLSPFFHPPIS